MEGELVAPMSEGFLLSAAPCIAQLFSHAAFHEGLYSGHFSVAHRAMGHSPLFQSRPQNCPPAQCHFRGRAVCLSCNCDAHRYSTEDDYHGEQRTRRRWRILIINAHGIQSPMQLHRNFFCGVHIGDQILSEYGPPVSIETSLGRID